MKTIILIAMITFTCLLYLVSSSDAAWVVREGDRIYIEDRTGERWDVTQAQRLGFVPHRFQYGIGKNAFTPLHDGDFTDDRPISYSRSRVIGVSVENDAHAYSVGRLKYHEIANTTIAGHPIAAGY